MWNGSWGWMHGGHGGWGFSMFGMGLFWILLLVILVILVLRVVGDRDRAAGEPSRREDTPLEILKRRYARGEIDHDEFERRRRDLTP